MHVQRSLVGAMVIMATASPLLAAEESIVEQAMRCLNIPAGIDQSVFRAEFDVLFDQGVVEDIAVVKFQPQGSDGEKFVRAASRALQRCSPYSGPALDGVVRVTMCSPEAVIGGKPSTIDPFRPLGEPDSEPTPVACPDPE